MTKQTKSKGSLRRTKRVGGGLQYTLNQTYRIPGVGRKIYYLKFKKLQYLIDNGTHKKYDLYAILYELSQCYLNNFDIGDIIFTDNYSIIGDKQKFLEDYLILLRTIYEHIISDRKEETETNNYYEAYTNDYNYTTELVNSKITN
jgi:hypothetical protein